MIEAGECSWTIWTAAAWNEERFQKVPPGSVMVVIADHKEALPPMLSAIPLLRSLADTTQPKSIVLRSEPGENVADLLHLNRPWLPVEGDAAGAP